MNIRLARMELGFVLLVVCALSGCKSAEKGSEKLPGQTQPSQPAVNSEKAATIGVYKSNDPTFLLHYSNTTGFAESVVPFGVIGDVPIVGDWDGDGSVTIGVYRPENSTFYLRNSNTPGNAEITVAFGKKGDIPVVGDWDGNRSTTVGVYRPENSTFYLRNANTPGDAEIPQPLEDRETSRLLVTGMETAPPRLAPTDLKTPPSICAIATLRARLTA